MSKRYISISLLRECCDACCALDSQRLADAHLAQMLAGMGDIS